VEVARFKTLVLEQVVSEVGVLVEMEVELLELLELLILAEVEAEEIIYLKRLEAMVALE